MTFSAIALPDAAPGNHAGRCAACGASTTTGHATTWSNNFVALDLLADARSPVVCAPCAALLGNSPRVSPKASQRPLGWRMFSLLARAGHPLQYANKAEKPRIRTWLLAAPYTEPWGVHLADSGKKQMAPFAPVNRGGASAWTIQLETTPVRWTTPALRAHLDTVDTAYQLGVSKAELTHGQWGLGRLRTLRGSALTHALDLERALRSWIGSPQHQLAVWLSQRDDSDTEEAHDDNQPDDE